MSGAALRDCRGGPARCALRRRRHTRSRSGARHRWRARRSGRGRRPTPGAGPGCLAAGPAPVRAERPGPLPDGGSPVLPGRLRRWAERRPGAGHAFGGPGEDLRRAVDDDEVAGPDVGHAGPVGARPQAQRRDVFPPDPHERLVGGLEQVRARSTVPSGTGRGTPPRAPAAGPGRVPPASAGSAGMASRTTIPIEVSSSSESASHRSSSGLGGQVVAGPRPVPGVGQFGPLVEHAAGRGRGRRVVRAAPMAPGRPGLPARR